MGFARSPLAIALTLGLSCSHVLPPQGEALVIIDTDAPLRVVNRLRVDFLDESGRWLDSRDVARPNAGDWPVSFSIYVPDPGGTKLVYVRLRAYPESKARAYRGERFVDKTPPDSPGDPAFLDPKETRPPPRLMHGNDDVTPPTEPQPFVTIDRLVAVRLTTGERGSLRVTLRGACLGNMTDVAGKRSCVDTDGTLIAVRPSPLDADMTLPRTTITKDFGLEIPCPADAAPHPSGPLLDQEVCVPGGTFVLGNDALVGSGDDSPTPERIVMLSPFYMDMYEVTVARWRDALRRGFTSPDASPTQQGPGGFSYQTCAAGGLAPASSIRWCTWTKQPSGLEAYAITCLTWAAARAFCRFDGGDLASEAQWEYVAIAYGRAAKTKLPWGDDTATCKPSGDTSLRPAVWGRLSPCNNGVEGRESCVGTICGPQAIPNYVSACDSVPDPMCRTEFCGLFPNQTNDRQGPQPVNAVDFPGGDRSDVLGIVNLAGGVSEWLADTYRRFDSLCWATASLLDPICTDDGATRHSVRSASWASQGPAPAYRHADDAPPVSRDYGPPQIGFRCVRPVTP